MLSIKLAQQLLAASQAVRESDQVGIVLSLHTDSQSWEPHRELLETLEIQNNFIAYKQVRTQRSNERSHFLLSCQFR
jgi:hypothetical protein